MKGWRSQGLVRKYAQKFFIVTWGFLCLSLAVSLYAQEFTSPDFRVIDPVLYSAEFSTSSDYQLIGSISQMAIGLSMSGDHSMISGSLAYPFVTTPVLAASAGDGSVSLLWTSATGFLGWTVSGYHVGRATTSGGPYTYTSSLGNVTSHTVTGLSNGTEYYFVVRVEDAFGNPIATTSEVSATPQASTPPPPTPPPGGGGDPGSFGEVSSGTHDTVVNISGLAYPDGEISFLLNGEHVHITRSNSEGIFRVDLAGMPPGHHTIGVLGRDTDGRVSPLRTVRVHVREGIPAQVTGFLVSPTIESDKIEVRQGESVRVFGQAPPGAQVTAHIHSLTLDEDALIQTVADGRGRYSFTIETRDLPFGRYVVSTDAAVAGNVSSTGREIAFSIGERTVPVERDIMKGDLNKDGRVNLLDFSIAAYWYDRPFSEEFARIERERLNGDGKITLADFSLMAYYWTG